MEPLVQIGVALLIIDRVFAFVRPLLVPKVPANSNGAAGEKSVDWWINKNTEIISRSMEPHTQVLGELAEGVQDMSKILTKILTILEQRRWVGR